MTAAVPADLQLTETYFVVAHIHYVLIGVNLFAVLGALHVWVPKMSGRMMDERLGKIAFWIIFIGFNMAFLPMHLTGMLGMPRRIYTYPAGVGWDALNMTTSVGAFVLALGLLVYLVNLGLSLRRGELAGPNPWDAPSLEWATPSPPPPYNFPVVPTVASRHPLWENRMEGAPLGSKLRVGSALPKGKEALATTFLDAEPDAILKMPVDSPAPFLVTVAMSVFFATLLLKVVWLGAAAGLAILIGVLVWLWPEREPGQRARAAL